MANISARKFSLHLQMSICIPLLSA